MSKSPTAARRQGFRKAKVLVDICDSEVTAPAPSFQDNIAIRRLVARFGLPIATASAVAQANAWGGANVSG